MSVKTKQVRLFRRYSLVLAAAVFVLAACGNKGSQAAAKTAPVVIRVGTHHQSAHDPTWRDAITGEPEMSPDDMRVGEIALKKVQDELNVKLEWVNYSSDVREELLRSVLAGDPVCDIAFLWGGCQGTILGQNILQDLSPFADVFEGDADADWMLLPPVFGRRYFFGYKLAQVDCWPLVFNINYIERVDALKENGQTVYPTDLYKQGTWTWQVFEDYLDKISAYYRNAPSPVRPEVPIKAFQTDYRVTATSLLHSAGQAVYGENGIMFDTPEAVSAVEYLDRLMSRGLVMSVRYGDTSVVPGWTWNGNDFGNGETVFTDMPFWIDTSAGNNLAGRGESMGIVPYPRPDGMAFDDPRYQQPKIAGDNYGVLKGVPADRARLALEALKLYYLTGYRERAGSSRALDFLDTSAEVMAVADGYDIYHEKIGADILKIYASYSPPDTNEFDSLLGISNIWEETITGQSIYGFDGSPKYAVNAAQKRVLVENALAATEAAIASGKTTDNIQPNIAAAQVIAVPRGTDPAGVNFASFVDITDNVDGTIDPARAAYDYSSPDFNKAGSYEGGKGLHVTVKDAAGNERKTDLRVVVYDPDNKQPPTITPKETLPAVKAGTDISGVDWKGAYLNAAVDKDGIDIKDTITVDVSGFDSSTPGTYNVTVTATDFAGNAANITLPVTVE
ncbi:MAG: hypothetical protein LBG76_01720 [Treponema sp.]|jgi:predicted small lipoprotein YifL|nr:hypothetical protein [Treponema sp.]